MLFINYFNFLLLSSFYKLNKISCLVLIQTTNDFCKIIIIIVKTHSLKKKIWLTRKSWKMRLMLHKLLLRCARVCVCVVRFCPVIIVDNSTCVRRRCRNRVCVWRCVLWWCNVMEAAAAESQPEEGVSSSTTRRPRCITTTVPTRARAHFESSLYRPI